MGSSPPGKHTLTSDIDLLPRKRKKSKSGAIVSDDTDSGNKSPNIKRRKGPDSDDGKTTTVADMASALGIPKLPLTSLFAVPGAQSTSGLVATSHNLPCLDSTINDASIGRKPRQSSLPAPTTPVQGEQQKSMPPETPPRPPPIIVKPRAVSSTSNVPVNKSLFPIAPIATIAKASIPNTIANPIKQPMYEEWTSSNDSISWAATIYKGIE
ncbi:hypothetical protein K439DRAFT_1614851 [Ramaria rubella]|nr:hypothetical protein K439DRAFT_1614851 [Ramaria rubella]